MEIRPSTAKSAVAMARWADRASSLVVLLVALAPAALADGDQLASVQLISTPEQLATLITQTLGVFDGLSAQTDNCEEHLRAGFLFRFGTCV